MLRLSRFRPVGSTDLMAALRTLGVARGASMDDVRTRYLALAKKHHPDLLGGDDSAMKVVNVAYETVQLHGSTEPEDAHTSHTGVTATSGRSNSKVGRMVEEDQAWNVASDDEWLRAVSDISEKELQNPANHPQSFSKYYSFDDDVSIYQLIRSGATINQVARTLGRPPSLVARRLNNAQFKQRIRIVLTDATRRENNITAGRSRDTERRRPSQAPFAQGSWTQPSFRAPPRSPTSWEEKAKMMERDPNIGAWTSEDVYDRTARNYAAYRDWSKRKN